MKQSEAITILTKLMRVLQKTRSNAAYELGLDKNPTMAAVVKDVTPYTFDDKRNILQFIPRVLGKPGGPAPMDFYNIMSLCRLEPAIGGIYSLFESGELPEPDMKMVLAWDKE